MSLEAKQPFEGRSSEEDEQMFDEERERFPTGQEVSYNSIVIGDPDQPEDVNYLGHERTLLLEAYDKGGEQREALNKGVLDTRGGLLFKIPRGEDDPLEIFIPDGGWHYKN